MVNEDIFAANAREYDAWFDNHALEYKLELEVIRTLLPTSGNGVEIGVGTGRFAESLGITLGIEPAVAMGAIATARGVRVITGKAESLPLESNKYDFALMVTTDCFLDSLEVAYQEVYRILKTGGYFLIGFINRESVLGKKYSARKNISKNVSKFYQGATFHRPKEIMEILKKVGFRNFEFSQALLPADVSAQQQPVVKQGYGEGSFVILRACKKS